MDGAAPGPVGLPRTRSFRRARPLRVWWQALAIAIVANLGLVTALSQVSHLAQPAPEPPLAVRSLRRVDPEPPPPLPDPPRQVAAAQPRPAAPVVALPALDLPAVSPSSGLSLPDVGAIDAPLDLPLSIPAFAAIGAGDPPEVPAGGLHAGPPAFDTPAQREGVFDLERHYPRAARQRRITGTSRVRIVIDASGRVGEVRVLESVPHGVFEQAAERLGRSLRFRPAQAAGKPVASVQETTIEWTMR